MPDDLESDQEPRIPERLHRDSETKSTTTRSSRSSFGEEEGDACDGDAGAGEEGIQGREGEIASTGATEDGHGVSSGGSPDGSGTGAAGAAVSVGTGAAVSQNLVALFSQTLSLDGEGEPWENRVRESADNDGESLVTFGPATEEELEDILGR